MYKLVIVEDENDVRSRIVGMIEKSHSKFQMTSEYTTGIDAYDGILADNPDLILTDIKVPFINGIELVKKVREFLPFVKVIFITGFDEFEYAKEAANLGVIGFVSKPVTFNELDAVLRKAEEAMNDEYLTASNIKRLSAFYENNLPIIRENDLYRLSYMSGVTPAFESKLRGNGINLNYGFLMVCIFAFDAESEEGGEWYELAFSSIKKTVAEEIDGAYDYEIYHRYEKFCLILKSHTPPVISDLSRRFEHIVQRVGRYSGMPVSAGLSSVYENDKNFVAMHKEAMRSLSLRAMMGGNNVFFYKDITTASSRLSVDDNAIRELSYMMHFQSPQKCLVRIDEIWAYFRNVNVSPYYVTTNIANVLIKACDDLDGLYSLYGGDPSGLYINLHKIGDEDRAVNFLKELAQQIISLNENVITDNMDQNLRKIVYYMETHFCDPDISFETLASGVNFSISYIGTLLRKKLNTSFVKMLTSLRMEKAKLLLTDPSLKIVDVAEQLGYNDSYYFSHCFKKYVGVSPREYKK